MTYYHLEDQFDFDKYKYEIVFEEVETSFWERLFSYFRKETKLIYYIRRVWRELPSRSEQVLHKDMDNYSLGYKFGERGNLALYFKVCYYNDISEPQKLLQKIKYRVKPSQDNVVLSSDDL